VAAEFQNNYHAAQWSASDFLEIEDWQAGPSGVRLDVIAGGMGASGMTSRLEGGAECGKLRFDEGFRRVFKRVGNGLS
jgi:hypothetical protein